MKRVRPTKRFGFTLTELLVSLLLIGIIMGAVLGLFFAIVKHMEQSGDITTAQQHGESVIYLLKPVVLQAGLGMSEDVFQNNFTISGVDDLLTGLTTDEKRTLYISPDNRSLAVFYSVPSDVIVSGEKAVSSADTTLNIIGTIPSGVSAGDGKLASSWITFAATGYPLFVKTTSPLTVKSAYESTVYNLDKLNFLKIAKATVSNDHFLFQDISKPSDEPQTELVEGIVDIQFDVDETNKIFSVYVLCRGNVRFDQQISAPPIGPFTSLSEESKHYRLRIVEDHWRYRN